jgi:hypothetical protein
MTEKMTEEELQERDDQDQRQAYDEPSTDAEEPDLTDQSPTDPPPGGRIDPFGHPEVIPDEPPAPTA